MYVVLVWFAAYVLTGFLYVHRDLSFPIYRQPNYVRSAQGRWIVRAAWLLVTFRLMFVFGRFHPRYFMTEALPSYLTFLAVGAFGTWLISN